MIEDDITYRQRVQIANNIEFIRILRGILGNALGGISKQAVSKMFQKIKISEEKLVKITRILNVTPEGIKKG